MAAPSSLGFGLLNFVSAAGMTILDIMDFISNTILMPLSAIFICLFTGWWAGTKIVVDEVNELHPFKSRALFVFMIKWVSPPCMLIILVSYLLNSLGIISL
jgi:NSS family neurotransmitter:Na+ symporter